MSKRLAVTCKRHHWVDCDDLDTARWADIGDNGVATWDESTEQWSILWARNSAWGFYTQSEADQHCTFDGEIVNA